MLPKANRLSRHDFPDTRSLKRVTSPHFSLSYGESSPGGVAVVVSKKVARFAVSRHLLKRRIMTILRPFVRDTLVLIVHTRPGAAALPFPELERELNSLLRSILPT